MKNWKKALSTLATASMLASLLAIGAVGSVSAAASAKLDAATCNPAGCTQVADGLSLVQVGAVAGAGFANGGWLTITGGSFVSVAAQGANGDFVYVDPTRVNITNTGTAALVAADVFRVTSATAGTATVTVHYLDGSLVAQVEGTFDITFVAAGSLAVSAANSTVTLSATSLKADGTNTADVDVIVKNGASTPAAITTGLTVSATITPVGLVVQDAGAGYAQAASDGSAGSVTATAYEFTIKGSGIAGTATITFSVTDSNSVTTALGSKTVTFTGAVASVAAKNLAYSLDKTSGATNAVNFTLKDAAGNYVSANGSTVTVSDATIFSAAVSVQFAGDPATPGVVQVDCLGPEGSGTVTVKNNSFLSNAVTIYCSALAVDTFTVAFDKTTVAPGGSAILTVTAKDASGQPAVDGVAAPGVPVLSAGGITAWSGVKNGVSTATYLAPFNTGVVTALVSMTALTTASPVSVSINVSAPVPAVTSGTNASALGVTTTGTFSTSTKVAALGKYQTFKISFGAGAAGASVGIMVQTKNSAGVWSSSTRVTGRTADSSGNVYYYVKNSAAAWISVRGSLGSVLSNAVQGRWS